MHKCVIILQNMSEIDPQSQWLKDGAGINLHPIDVQRIKDMVIPTISVDRAVSHLIEDFEVDIDGIQSFYYSLPHPSKLQLENLHIHFSAARPVNHKIGTVGSGVFFHRGTKSSSKYDRKLTPELESTDKPTILIFLGSALLEREDGANYQFTDKQQYSEVINMLINETLAHELTHFAQIDEADTVIPSTFKRLTDCAQLAAAKGLLSILRNKRDVAVGLCSAAIAEVTTSGGMGSLAVGIGTAALSHKANINDRRVIRAEKDFSRYKESDKEIDARKHQEDAPELCSVVMVDDIVLPKGHGVDSFIKPEGERLTLALAHDRHKELSVTPRGGNYKDICKASFRSELSAIKVRPSFLKRQKNR